MQVPVENAGRTIRLWHLLQRYLSIVSPTTLLRIYFVLIGQPRVSIGPVTHTALIGPASLTKAIRVNDPQDAPLAMASLEVHIPNGLTVHLLKFR